MRHILFILLFLFFSHFGYATHNRGARIEARPISPTSFQITITTYTKTSSLQADRPSLDSVHTGDGFVIQFIRSMYIDLPGDLRVNTYINNHNYPGQGRYLIYFIDPNRNADIINIPHSVSIPFAVETEIVIDSNFSCQLYSPHFLARPFFIQSIGRDISMNVTAYDPNKDSLSYILVPCHGGNNAPIPGYWIPGGVDINPYTGEFHWNKDSMNQTGDYNFAVRIDKWYNGFNIGHCLEDFSLELDSGNTSADFVNITYPVNPLGFYSSTISPGNTFNLHVEFVDASAGAVLNLISEAANVCTLSNSQSGDTLKIDLTWIPSIYDSRKQPYSLIFRGEPTQKDLTYLLYVDGLSMDTCYSLIGINEISNANGNLSVYPNPANDFLEIEFISDLNISESSIQFCIYDINGRCIINDKLERTNSAKFYKQISTREFAAGIYVARLLGENFTETKKIIIEK